MQTAPSIIREVPPESPVGVHSTDPASKTVFNEPVLRVDNIQEAIIPGFSKSHRILLFLRVHREDPKESDGVQVLAS